MADLFEVTSTEVAVASRRLTSAANIQALGIGANDDASLNSMIDRVSALAVNYCNLAVDITGKAPTFARETCRATWFIAGCSRGTKLLLPWRVPIASITSVVEDGITLTAATDYQITGGGILLRLSNDAPICWSSAKIVVTYTAGWAALPTNVPPDLEARVIDQIRMEYQGRLRDPALRSRAVPDVYEASYSVVGGDSLGESGLLFSLEGALAPYRSIAVA